MNKLFFSALVLLICGLLLYSNNGTLSDKKATQALPNQTASKASIKNLYKDTEKKFSIQFPDGWKIVTGKNNVVAGDGIAAININIRPLPDEIKDYTMERLTDDDIELVIKGEKMIRTDTNFQFHQRGTTYINNKKVVWIKTSEDSPTGKGQITTTLNMLWYNGIQYSITCAAQSHTYDSYHKLFEASVNSFVIES